MTTINEKLAMVPEDRFTTRLVELWTFFFGTVLPYLQGIFEPLKPDAALLKELSWLDASSTPASAVRDIALVHFRTDVLLPNIERLHGTVPSLRRAAQPWSSRGAQCMRLL